MATVSSLLPAPVGHVLSRPSPASPGPLACSTGNRSRSAVPHGTVDAAATALALPSVSLLPARLKHEAGLYPLNIVPQTPRSSAAALAATAAADAATAAAAAARAAAVAAAAAGAAYVVNRSNNEEVEQLEKEDCCLHLRSIPSDSPDPFFKTQYPRDAAFQISGSGARSAYSNRSVDAGPATTVAAASAARPSSAAAAAAEGKRTDLRDIGAAAVATPTSRSYKADLSLACRPVQRHCGGRTLLALPSMPLRDEEETEATTALEESGSATGSDISDKIHVKSTAGGAHQNGKQPTSLSRTLSCFSSFSFKPKGKFVPKSSGTRIRSNESSKKMTNASNTGRDIPRSNSNQSSVNNAFLCTRAAAFSEAAVRAHNEHAEQSFEEEKTTGTDSLLHAEQKFEEVDAQQSATKLQHLVGICRETQTESRTTCGTSRRGSALPLASPSVVADVGCHSAERIANQLYNNNTYVNNSTNSDSQYSCYREDSHSNNSNGSRSSVLHSSPIGGHTAYRSPGYSSTTDGGREGNIYVLGSARQVTPESSRISSRMSCGGDDASLVAHVEFPPLCATAATATRRGEGGRITVAEATGAAAAGEFEDVEDLGADSRGEKMGDEIFQRRRGGKRKDHTSVCIQQRRQQQHERDNRKHQMAPRCLSLPGEFFVNSDNRLHTKKTQHGFCRPLTAQDIVQLQHQRRSEDVQEKTIKNVLTSKYLLSTVKLDLLKLRKAEKGGISVSSVSSALSTSRQSSPFTRGDISSPREEFSRKTSHPESSSSVKSFQSSSSASSSSSSIMCFNSSQAAASVVALTRSSPRSSETYASCCSSSPSSSFALSSTSLTSFAASLAVKGKQLLSTMLPSLLLLVEPPSESSAAPRQPKEATEIIEEKTLYGRYFADSREAETMPSATPERQCFSEWGYHGLSPLDAIEETEERKATRSSRGDSTPMHVPPILIQGDDEVEMLHGTSFRRNTIVRHSLSRAKELWEKIINCCW